MKKWLTLLIVFLVTTGWGDSLIRNPDLNLPFDGEYSMLSHNDCVELSLFTEPASWNKCARLEIRKYAYDGDFRTINGHMLIGGKKGLPGFKVKPDTVYTYTLSIKGQGERVFIKGVGWKQGAALGQLEKLTEIDRVGMVKLPGEWTTLRGSFRTGPDTERAAISAGFWGDSRQQDQLKEKIGDYLLVDNVEVKERSALIPAQPETAAKLVPKKCFAIADGSENSGFTLRKTGAPPLAQTRFKVTTDADGFRFKFECLTPEPENIRMSAGAAEKDPRKIWEDDLLEVFFAPVGNDRSLTQLVVTAGGAVFTGFGGPAAVKAVPWQVEVSRTPGGWTAEMAVPYRLLGWDKPPQTVSPLGFNVIRQNLSTNEFSSWSPVENNFHDKSRFGILLNGPLAVWRSETLPGQEKTAAVFPVQIQAAAREILAEMKQTADPAVFQDGLEKLNQLQLYAKLGTRRFAVTPMETTASTLAPLLPDRISEPVAKIRVRGAVNERIPFRFAVTNLTGQMEEYRILLFSREDNAQEVEGLTGFPVEKISILRAVRVKESENQDGPRRFDPLAPLDASRTIHAPPGDSGMCWVNFDATGAKPGIYRGTLRVIPLGEPMKMGKKNGQWFMEGAVADIPFELEILPIVLDRTPAVPRFAWRNALNEDIFKIMVDEDIRAFQISPWGFDFEYDANGFRTGKQITAAEKRIMQDLEYAEKYGIRDEISFVAVYSAFKAFSELTPQFKRGTSAWRNAWQEYIRGIAGIFERHRIPFNRYTIEIEDEPASRNLKQDDLVEICKLAKEAVPEIALMYTACSKLNADTYPKLEPYIDVYCIWSGLFTREDLKPMLKRLRDAGKRIWIYQCEIGISNDLARYYRRHPWLGEVNGVELLTIYHYIPGNYGEYGSTTWKCLLDGALAYRAGDTCLSSIRNECLLIGMTDLAYRRAFRKALDNAAARGKAPELIAEAENFYRTSPTEVTVTKAYDAGAPERIREQTISYILKLQDAD